MRPYISFGMVFGRLGYTLKCFYLGQTERQEPGSIEQLKAAPGIPFREDTHDFIADSLGGNSADETCLLLNSGKRSGFNGKFQTGGEAHCPKHAQVVFVKTQRGIADSPNDCGSQVRLSVYKIKNLPRERVLHEAVNGEIAPLRVQGRIHHKANGVGTASVRVRALASKSGDLNLNAAFISHHDYSEMSANELRLWKMTNKLIRLRIRADIEVFRDYSQQPITNTATDEVCLVA